MSLLQRRDGFVSAVGFEEPAPRLLVDVMPGFASGGVAGMGEQGHREPCVARLFADRPTGGLIQLD